MCACFCNCHLPCLAPRLLPRSHAVRIPPGYKAGRQTTAHLRAQREDELQPSSRGDSGDQPANAETRGRDYYAGLVTTGLETTNDATSSDMLARSLQLAGEFIKGFNQRA